MVSESVAQGASLPRGVGACIHTLPESVVSLIPWRPRCSEEAAVPLGRPQSRSSCSNAGTSVVRDNRLANSVQTHFFRYRQCGSCRQARALDAATLRLARQGGGGRWKTLRAAMREKSARGGQEKALHRGLCGAARRGSDLRAGEKVRERAGVAGARARRFSRTGDARGSLSSRCP